MLDWPKINYMFLNLLLKLLVRSTVIPVNLRHQVNLDLRQPIIYLLAYNSKADLLTLRTQCLKQGLPDPLIPLDINGVILARYLFIHDGPRGLSWYAEKSKSVLLFHNYLKLQRLNPTLNVQLVPVSVMFGRAPGRESHTSPPLRLLSGIEKLFTVLWLGRDSFVRFSRPLSLAELATEHGTDQCLAPKLARVARIHFTRQRLVATGPRLPLRQDLFHKLLSSTAIAKAVEEEARSKKITVEQAQNNAIKLMEEIAADVSYETIRLFDRILSWTWNRLYQGLHIHHAERVRQLAENGHEMVYVPCHRSHMDYLLLSYVLYYQGLVPPHIAAGINLNFWPIGTLFRRLGAFFIRRTFKGNKLYSTIVREYLGELFSRGYPVEYFIEGGRSRTGRLLKPRTGMLTMTIQAMLRGGNRPITLVPIYIGYEHVMELATYTKELRGATKAKESVWQMICGLRQLRDFGQGYVNFGEPIPLTSWLSQQVPQWRNSIDPLETQRPAWLATAVDNIAATIMVRINNAAAANAINLCSTILLASRQRSLTRPQLLAQLNCYLELLRNVPYGPDITVPELTPQRLLAHALSMNKFSVKQDLIGEIICLSRDQAVLMTYYRNNIQHLLILPALVASIICSYPGIESAQLQQRITLLYPLLKAELFMRYSKQELLPVIDSLISELVRQGLVERRDMLLYPVPLYLQALQMLAATVSETLQRYAITCLLLRSQPQLNRSLLEQESLIIAQRLSILHGINAPEFFDKAVFSKLVATLYAEEYMSDTSDTLIAEKINQLYKLLHELITPEVLTTIVSTAYYKSI